MQSERNKIWKEGLYLEGRDYGHDFVYDNPDATEIEIESAIYNFLLEFDPSLKKYQELTDGLAARATRRVLQVRNIPCDR